MTSDPLISQLVELCCALPPVEAAGGEGLQLFVDAGVPVNSDLIRQYVNEGLAEMVTLFLGQRPASPAGLVEEIPIPEVGCNLPNCCFRAPPEDTVYVHLNSTHLPHFPMQCRVSGDLERNPEYSGPETGDILALILVFQFAYLVAVGEPKFSSETE